MTKIIKDETTKTGFALVDGDITLPIDELVDDGKTLKLPKNSSNRTYYSLKKVTEGHDELTYKETRTLTVKGDAKPKQAPWEDYLTDEEKSTLEILKAVAEQRRSQKTLDDLMAEKARLEAEIAKLTK